MHEETYSQLISIKSIASFGSFGAFKRNFVFVILRRSIATVPDCSDCVGGVYVVDSKQQFTLAVRHAMIKYCVFCKSAGLCMVVSGNPNKTVVLQ